MKSHSRRLELHLGHLVEPFYKQTSDDKTKALVAEQIKRTFSPKGYRFPSEIYSTLRRLYTILHSHKLSLEQCKQVAVTRDSIPFFSTLLALDDNHMLSNLSPQSFERLLLVMGESCFLRRFLLNQGNGVETFDDSFISPFDHNRLSQELADLLSSGPQSLEIAWQKLVYLKYRSLCQILACDLSDAKSLETTTADLSTLAGSLVHTAFHILLKKSEQQLSAEPLIVAMGKLGAQELNYASDIDLIYVANPVKSETALSEGLNRFFTSLGRLISQERDGAFLYRVDLALRPFGHQSPLVVTQDALIRYLERHASLWEKFAYIKARLLIGPDENQKALQRAVSERIWTRYLDFRAIDHIREMKQQIDYETTKYPFDANRLPGWNVKLGSGGIREIEFFVQTHQMIYGGKKPRLRARKTIEAIRHLVEAKLLDEQKAETLMASYTAFRRLEHHLQLYDEAHLFELPRQLEPYQSCIDSFPIPESELLNLRSSVIDLFHTLVAEERPSRYRQLRYEIEHSTSETDLNKNLSNHQDSKLRSLSVSPQSWDTLKTLFSVGALRDFPPDARNSFHQLVEMALDSLMETDNPDRAIHTFNRFLRGVKGKVVFFNLLLHNPTLVRQLTTLFSKSPFLSELLLKSPDGLDAILLKRKVNRNSYHVDAALDLQSQLQSADFETALDILRRFKKQELLRVGFTQLIDGQDLAVLHEEMHWLADTCISATWRLALDQILGAKAASPSIRLAAFGMGRLGAKRLHFASDLDLIFFFAPSSRGSTSDPSDDQELAIKAAHKVISTLSLTTREGRLFEIDPRLRPSGNQGVLVSSINSFSTFLDKQIESWHRLALFKLRPVVGDEELLDTIGSLVRNKLFPPKEDHAKIQDEVADLIKRLRSERSPYGTDSELKTGAGGLLELELLVQTKNLLSSSQSQKWDTASLIDNCFHDGSLSRADTTFLHETANLFDKMICYSALFTEGAGQEAGNEVSVNLASFLGYRSAEELQEQIVNRRHRITEFIEKMLPMGNLNP